MIGIVDRWQSSSHQDPYKDENYRIHRFQHRSVVGTCIAMAWIASIVLADSKSHKFAGLSGPDLRTKELVRIDPARQNYERLPPLSQAMSRIRNITMKYVTLIDYEIQGVFDTMKDALDDINWKKQLGYDAYIETIREDSSAFHQELMKKQMRIYWEKEHETNRQIADSKRRLAQFRPHTERIEFGVGVVAAIALLLMIVV